MADEGKCERCEELELALDAAHDALRDAEDRFDKLCEAVRDVNDWAADAYEARRAVEKVL